MGIRIPFYDFWSYVDGTSAVADLQSNGDFKFILIQRVVHLQSKQQGDIAKGEIIITDLFGEKYFKKVRILIQKKQNIFDQCVI
ncbi:MAG: hypothetical protein IPN88_16135 [Bacteroidetes bacterium]|nr:hypothetical protein [Bacteroidota bacterium]